MFVFASVFLSMFVSVFVCLYLFLCVRDMRADVCRMRAVLRRYIVCSVLQCVAVCCSVLQCLAA